MPVSKSVLVVAAGGALGATVRFILAQQWPGIWTILAINVVGSLLLGYLAEMLGPDRPLRLFLGVGVLGGFTTFSTFAVDAVGEDAGRAALYVTATLLPALLAARLGMLVGHRHRRARGALV
ncbi:MULTISPECIES: fluoride efflux transporter FluC [Rhodococcus]|uniref:Fluoride-specific ion channel FluC n=1 Tax=Rhodococcus oxybenzonivorans TaxID=1990687 RepID=A0AAE4UXE9_9NOCA|nr:MULTISPECIES: CrcB family protein [Rhodococcus]MDV7244689.1 CrcB family protein [Rhodococcus oxybenzonivorans]MDV7264059.1 CrcB family protein [Rhodococcus oxybenzonivorans]MDV7275812.1 CrcB family protein [Rhodococcus oxybenzonivorans]MDV7332589.1 CrcB family protein [Rhodococcus oxybenzonivorans]MDV7346385.1 CrcB family protein [Rhodococcus oxybenzonivorans]